MITLSEKENTAVEALNKKYWIYAKLERTNSTLYYVTREGERIAV